MLNILGHGGRPSRRELLHVGGLAMAGLTLADVLRLRAASATVAGRAKSVILVWLRGGASRRRCLPV